MDAPADVRSGYSVEFGVEVRKVRRRFGSGEVGAEQPIGRGVQSCGGDGCCCCWLLYIAVDLSNV